MHGFDETLSRAVDGEELSIEEWGNLLSAEGENLNSLIRAADESRKRRAGDVVTYVINRNINYTNICTGSCKFCAFRRSPRDPDAYVLTPEQIMTKVREAVKFGATEVCIQGGLHPNLKLEDYVRMLEAIREVSADIHIHAFSPAEIAHMTRKGITLPETIETLKEAGLNSVPGTAAEILDDRVRGIICPGKITSGEWVEIIKTCHLHGVPTTATMMYGHVETPAELVKHLITLKEIQMETGGFTELVPLPIIPYNTELYRLGLVLSPPSLTHNLRVHAVARLMLAGYIDNVQASWVKLGPAGAQLMLNAGANDLSGTLMEENITRAAGGRLQSMTPEELRELILRAGRIPAQRTTTYEILS